MKRDQGGSHRPGTSLLPTGLVLIAVGYLVLASLFAAYIPIWRAPDESAHFIYIRWMADHWALPIFQPDNPGVEYEFHQPPLYYAIAALVHQGTETLLGHESPHAIRFLSVVIGLLLIYFTFHLGRELFPERKAIPYAAAGFVAFLPMNLAVCASISNDPLCLAIFAAVLFLLVKGLREEFTTKRLLIIGGLIGLGLITKNHCIILLPVAWLAVLLGCRREPGCDWLGGIASVLILTLVASAVGGWWLVRNQFLYGDPLAMEALLTQAHGKGEPTPQALMQAFGLTLSEYLVLFPLWWTFRSFWGVFGEMNVFLPPSVYVVMMVITLAAVIGLIQFLAREWKRFSRWQHSAAWVLIFALALVFVSYARYNSDLFQAQARYLFPALPIFGLAFALGVQQLLPGTQRAVVAILLPVGMAIFSAVALPLWILPKFGYI